MCTLTMFSLLLRNPSQVDLRPWAKYNLRRKLVSYSIFFTFWHLSKTSGDLCKPHTAWISQKNSMGFTFFHSGYSWMGINFNGHFAWMKTVLKLGKDLRVWLHSRIILVIKALTQVSFQTEGFRSHQYSNIWEKLSLFLALHNMDLTHRNVSRRLTFMFRSNHMTWLRVPKVIYIKRMSSHWYTSP